MEDDKLILWDYPKNFCGEKADLRKHPTFHKYPAFMVNRVMSMSPKTIFLAMFMSRYTDIPIENQFAFYNTEVDKEYIFFDYKKRSDEISAETIQYIREYFVCSLTRALEYINLLSEKQIKTIVDLYKIRDKANKKKKKKK